jgi:hypothetical protein
MKRRPVDFKQVEHAAGPRNRRDRTAAWAGGRHHGSYIDQKGLGESELDMRQRAVLGLLCELLQLRVLRLSLLQHRHIRVSVFP